MVDVYHNSDFLNYTIRIFSNKEIKSIPENLLTKVATVNTDILEQAYCLTNSIEGHWSENENVFCFKENARSTSMGDVFVREGVWYMVMDCGFKRIERESVTTSK